MSVADDTSKLTALLEAQVRIPAGVVYRNFVKETVILNLDTGQYHGVNPVGGRMLAVLEKSGSLGDAARTLAAEFGQELARIECDLCEFCEALIERGLLEIAPQ